MSAVFTILYDLLGVVLVVCPTQLANSNVANNEISNRILLTCLFFLNLIPRQIISILMDYSTKFGQKINYSHLYPHFWQLKPVTIWYFLPLPQFGHLFNRRLNFDLNICSPFKSFMVHILRPDFR